MKIAIHQSKWGFSSDWITYCQKENIPFKIVDCYETDIMKQLQECDVLLWHHHHTLPKDKIFAQKLLFALEQSGKTVFPDFNTGWHFDDKLGQKYLLEAVDAPLVPTSIFYSKGDAYRWIEQADFPLVFKLRCGAGSSNVRLVQGRTEARRLIRRAFGAGFAAYNRWEDFRDNFRKYRLKKQTFRELLKSARRMFFSTEFARIYGPEKGYVLFQEFLPGNSFDIRIIVIGGRAFAIKRFVRENDFRASGSGLIEYDRDSIDIRCVQIAFDVFDKLDAQCLAFDFVFDKNNMPLIVEINYGYAKEGYDPCPGYWDKDLNWVAGRFNSLHWIIDDIIQGNHASVNDLYKITTHES